MVKGRSFSSPNAKELICPRHFTIDGETDALFGHTYIDGENVLNTKIKVIYNSRENGDHKKLYEEEYEIVGLYDERLAAISGYNCFTSFENIATIKAKAGKTDNFSFPIMILDKKESFYEMEELFENLRQELGFGINYRPSAELDYEFEEQMHTLEMAIFSIVLFFLVIVSIILIFYQIKAIKEREKEIGLWKAIGYRNGQIQMILWIEQAMLILFAYLIAWVLFGIMVGTFFYLSNHVFYLLQIVTISIPFGYLVLLLLGILLLSWLIYQISFQKIKKINVMSIKKN